MMHKIHVEGIRVFAYHGCLDAEGLIGSNYVVDVLMDTDFTEAAKSDELEKTVDYVVVYEIVKKQMAVRSKLIEQVAQRIVDEMKERFGDALKRTEVKVTKINPPMNGEVEKVSVIIIE